MRRLLPLPPAEDVDPSAADTEPSPRPGRPWVRVNMIASLDGATAVAGRSGGLGGPGDRAVFHHLRRQADVILVGASTVRAEGYGPPKAPGQRVAVVTRSGRGLDPESELFTSGAGLVVLPEDGPATPLPAVRAGQGDVDLVGALARLADELGAGVVLCEGGPSLNGQLLAADLVDEMAVTVAPLAVAGDAARLAHSPAAIDPRAFRLASVLEEDGYLFCRYVRTRGGER